MLKLICLSILFIVTCNGMPGGYKDRPELLNDPIIHSLTSFGVEKLFESQNLKLTNVKVTRVQTQLVAGTNYKIDFTAKSVRTEAQTTCQMVIFVKLDGQRTLSQSQCQ
ncbi:unnamed protein product [Didymodactylos carnosus]|uniref:Cystatin domain-containing protein n=1 Tax=Didymodactylos carnosus TaxID=1234261 RepID=A0A813R4Z2_9BILA|nr:unnamed protein product [Didymodactylos carnosus]CAF3559164.1 unnamed protein product [Didymodactylos carnosus]